MTARESQLPIIEVRRTAYLSRTANRSFLTRKAAIHAEAAALIRAKHPTEPASEDDCDSGWHWTRLPRHGVLLRRVKRLVAKASRP